jgi:hypothetical protein
VEEVNVAGTPELLTIDATTSVPVSVALRNLSVAIEAGSDRAVQLLGLVAWRTTVPGATLSKSRSDPSGAWTRRLEPEDSLIRDHPGDQVRVHRYPPSDDVHTTGSTY